VKLELVTCKKNRVRKSEKANPSARAIMRKDGYVTPNEAAFLCGFSVNKIYHLMHGGKLDYCECGGLRFVLRFDLLRCIKAPPIQKRIRELELPSLD
jgi:hypothetical protein